MKYRQKPVVIEATQWFKLGDHPAVLGGYCPYIDTPERDILVEPGDWIITGVKGELFTFKPDLFELIYEAAA